MPDACVKCDRTATRQLQCTVCKGRWPVCRYCRTVPAVKKNCLCNDGGQFPAPARLDPASLDPWLTIAEQDDDDDEEDDQTATVVAPPSSPQQVSASSSQTPPSSPTKAPQTPAMPTTPMTPMTPVNSNTTSIPATPLKSPARRPGSALQQLDTLGQTSPLAPQSPFRKAKTSSPSNVDSNQPSSSAAPASPPQVKIDASVQRGLTGTSLGTSKPRPNELKILSWNVQNFTADHRLGTQRGALHEPANVQRLDIIADVMNDREVDALLLMETGSDVSKVLQEIGKRLVVNGDLTYEPLVSEETHGVPKLEDKYRIQPGAITARHVDALRNASEAFFVTVREAPAPSASDEAWKVWKSVRKSIPDPPGSDWVNECWKHIVDTLAELLKVTVKDANEFAQDLKATTYDATDDSLARLRADRSYAAAAFYDQPLLDEKLTAFLELLEILLLIELMTARKGLDLDQVPSLADRRPISCVALAARKTIVLDRRDHTDDIYSSENVKFVYDALRVLGCVEFYGETYGCAMRMDREQLERTFNDNELGAPVIERYDEQGALLPLQTPRSAVNWRSAVRMRLFLPNQGPDLLVYLFHTRFCFDATDLKTASGKTQAEKKIVLRCQSIETIAKVAKEKAEQTGKSHARMVLGDFNVPAYPVAFQDAAAAWSAAAGDYSQLPDSAPRTTLRSPGSFLSETGAALRAQTPVDPATWYSEPYDRALFHGGDALDCKCTALRVPEILPALDADRFWAVQMYYARCVLKINAVLNELRNYVKQATNRRAGKQIQTGTPEYDRLFGAQAAVRKLLDDRNSAMLSAKPDQVPQPDDKDIAQFLDDLANNIAALPTSFQTNVEAFADDIEYLFNQMVAIERNADARLHLAYARLVSDHVPLLLTIAKKQSS